MRVANGYCCTGVWMQSSQCLMWMGGEDDESDLVALTGKEYSAVSDTQCSLFLLLLLVHLLQERSWA